MITKLFLLQCCLFGCDFVMLRKKSFAVLLVRLNSFCLHSSSRSKRQHFVTKEFCNHLIVQKVLSRRYLMQRQSCCYGKRGSDLPQYRLHESGGYHARKRITLRDFYAEMGSCKFDDAL